MTQEEILEYNKRCAKFLNLKTLLTSSGEILYFIEDLPEITIPVDSLVINSTIQTGLLKATVKQLKFHSDWNWIHEVLEAIEKLNYYTKNECIRGVNYFNIYELKNNEEIFYGTGKSKKEAVVEAISKFLIWYNKNK